ncbi:MAG: flagellar motor switch protein FliN [Deltaproteobacteria bacterium]|nr:flagellar motor switch protein FliN [Deltaproteobacteria bacterium]
MADKVEQDIEDQEVTSPNNEDSSPLEEKGQEETEQASNEVDELSESEDTEEVKDGQGLDDVAKGDEESLATDDDLLAQEWENALEEGQGEEDQKPHFEGLEKKKKESTQKEAQNLDFILDIPLDVTVELGRTKMLINDLLQMGQGFVIELNRLAGEPVDVLVNNKLVARGDVVVVSDKFGVRITDIISPLERVKSLG